MEAGGCHGRRPGPLLDHENDFKPVWTASAACRVYSDRLCHHRVRKCFFTSLGLPQRIRSGYSRYYQRRPVIFQPSGNAGFLSAHTEAVIISQERRLSLSATSLTVNNAPWTYQSGITHCLARAFPNDYHAICNKTGCAKQELCAPIHWQFPDKERRRAQAAIGSSSQNWLPLPILDCTPTRPPIRSTPLRTRARPMPVPGYSWVVCNRSNKLKILS